MTLQPTNLLSLTLAAAEQRGTSRLVGPRLEDGRRSPHPEIETAYTFRDGVLSIGIGPTDSWADVRRSWETNRVAVRGGYVHEGYNWGAHHVLHAYPEIADANEVRLAGASMGGAIAVRLASLLISLTSVNVTWLETYGAPAALSPTLADQLADVPGKRYVCGHDVVPRRWPPGRCGYVHDRPATELPTQTPWNPLRGVFDHRLRSYDHAITTTNRERPSCLI